MRFEAVRRWFQVDVVLVGFASILATGGISGCDRAANGHRTAVERRTKAEISPAIAEKAEEILRAHPDAALGSEHPFTLDGKRYVGRIEEHDNPSSEPGRPPGKHRGVTVYED
jgi:hypothetical protein